MIGNSEEILHWLFSQEKDKVFKIEEYKKKRSLNANAYCWTLLGKIARKLGTTKELVYRDYIRHFGIYKIITIKENAVKTFKTLWNEKGLGFIAEESTLPSIDEDYIDIIAYYGTSSYNTTQMAQFIDYVVQEAKNLNIETLPENDIENLKRMWDNEK